MHICLVCSPVLCLIYCARPTVLCLLYCVLPALPALLYSACSTVLFCDLLLCCTRPALLLSACYCALPALRSSACSTVRYLLLLLYCARLALLCSACVTVLYCPLLCSCAFLCCALLLCAFFRSLPPLFSTLLYSAPPCFSPPYSAFLCFDLHRFSPPYSALPRFSPPCSAFLSFPEFFRPAVAHGAFLRITLLCSVLCHTLLSCIQSVLLFYFDRLCSASRLC